MRILDIALISICAALYAGFGYLTYLGIFTPAIGVVRFWPVVIIPAVFATLFGPLIGGMGAAIGIFISDMIIHGNALLSVTVGVPANFIAFYTLGYIGRKNITWRQLIMYSTSISIMAILISIGLLQYNLISMEVTLIFVLTMIISYILLLAVGYRAKKWISYEVGSFIGLLIGSIIVGMGVWGFSQFFLLPTGEANLPLYAAVIWFIWTFITEIPFLVILGPPILAVVHKAIPSLVDK